MVLKDSRARLLLAATVVVLFGAAVIHSRLSAKYSTTVASTGIVISQIYGGGGNAGATFRNDFIELFNLGNATVDVSNWSVQYTSASGTGWQVTSLCPSGVCTIAPGHYYLIQEAQGAGGSANLPAPDATGGVAMSATDGKVALVNSTVALSGACPLGASVIDLVGYGGASCFEGGGAASAASNTNAKARINGGCTDTDNNNSDFLSAGPNPRNSAAAAITCGVSPSPSPTPTPSPSPLCGVERWSVKTGTDADAGTIDLTSRQLTTIATMRSWTAPATIPDNNRIAPFETTVWTVNATLVQYKLEDDSDYHVVIRDDAGNTIITEIPYPGCVGPSSPFAAAIAGARAKFNEVFTPTGSFQFTNVPVQITGVAMFDFLHGQTGLAPNGIELHPILDIAFTPPPTIILEEGSNRAAAVDSVTLLRGPFAIRDDFNFSDDHHTRVMFFTSNLGLSQPDPSLLSVRASGVLLTIENVGTFSTPGLDASFVIVRLPDGLPPGDLPLTVTLRGAISNPAILGVLPP